MAKKEKKTQEQLIQEKYEELAKEEGIFATRDAQEAAMKKAKNSVKAKAIVKKVLPIALIATVVATAIAIASYNYGEGKYKEGYKDAKDAMTEVSTDAPTQGGTEEETTQSATEESTKAPEEETTENNKNEQGGNNDGTQNGPEEETDLTIAKVEVVNVDQSKVANAINSTRGKKISEASVKAYKIDGVNYIMANETGTTNPVLIEVDEAFKPQAPRMQEVGNLFEDENQEKAVEAGLKNATGITNDGTFVFVQSSKKELLEGTTAITKMFVFKYAEDGTLAVAKGETIEKGAHLNDISDMAGLVLEAANNPAPENEISK